MKSLLAAALGGALTLAVPAASVAQPADFLTAKKVACAPERMTRCKSPGVECETREASAGDKRQLLVIDFAAKKAFMRRESGERPFGDVAEDTIAGEVRTIALVRGAGERKSTQIYRLRKDGKMESTRNEGRLKLEITCTAAE